MNCMSTKSNDRGGTNININHNLLKYWPIKNYTNYPSLFIPCKTGNQTVIEYL